MDLLRGCAGCQVTASCALQQWTLSHDMGECSQINPSLVELDGPARQSCFNCCGIMASARAKKPTQMAVKIIVFSLMFIGKRVKSDVGYSGGQ